MEAVFLKILNMSLSASVLAAAVLILRPLLRRAPKWTRVMMWGIVGLRLVLPFSIRSVISLLPSAEPIPADIGLAQRPAIDSGVAAINDLVNPILSENFAPAPGASLNPLQLQISIGTSLWLIGAAVLLVYALVSAVLVRRRVRAAVKTEDGAWVCDYISSPFILGVFRPRIYLPSDLPAGARASVMAHERAHLSRRDYLWKPIGFVLLAVHWFNPLMWVGFILLCRDIELACDEKVIRESGAGEEEKKAYSEALLACGAAPSLRKLISACPLAFGEVGVRARVKSVLNYKKPAFWLILAAVILCVVLAVCFLTDPKKDAEQPLPAGDGVTVEVTASDGTKRIVTDPKTKKTLLDAVSRLGGYSVGSSEGHYGPAYIVEVTGADGEEKYLQFWNGAPQTGMMTYTVGRYEKGKYPDFYLDLGVTEILRLLDTCFEVSGSCSVRVKEADLSGKKPSMTLEWQITEGAQLGVGSYVGIVRLPHYPDRYGAVDVCTIPEEERIYDLLLKAPADGVNTMSDWISLANFDFSEPGYYEMSREIILDGKNAAAAVLFYIADHGSALTELYVSTDPEASGLESISTPLITLSGRDHFTLSFGMLISYVGVGNYTREDGILRLTTYEGAVYSFAISDAGITFLPDESTNPYGDFSRFPFFRRVTIVKK